MAFVSLFLLWPLLLLGSFLYLLNLSLPVIARVLLIWNILVLAVLLAVRHFWRRSGTMDRSYIDSLGGWKGVALRILRCGLIVLILWQVLLVLACIAYLIWCPDLLALSGLGVFGPADGFFANQL